MENNVIIFCPSQLSYYEYLWTGRVFSNAAGKLQGHLLIRTISFWPRQTHDFIDGRPLSTKYRSDLELCLHDMFWTILTSRFSTKRDIGP